MLEIAFAIMFVILAIVAPGFASMDNVLNVVRYASMQGIIAFGMTMVIIANEIDLSVGSSVTITGCILAWVAKALHDGGMDLTYAIIAGFAVIAVYGIALGCLISLLRNLFDVPSFIITLAMLIALQGFAYLITGGFPIIIFPDWYSFIGSGYVLGRVPTSVIAFVLVFVAINFIMKNTTFGRSVYAIGGNLEAARLNGIRIFRIKTVIMIITALLACVSGVMVSSQIMSGAPNAAIQWEMDVIAAVIIGGTSFTGGRGSVWGTLMGVLILGFLMNGMTLLNINEYWQFVMRAGLLLGAVLVSNIQEKRRLRKIAKSTVA